ncbi:hypothetical protein [Marinospirillum alkaliphilum]|uniref:Uncharacterized protein n=1 Tax=Marinospirillum alkaliphilum DSM 21637 TaxID=1122209 RepID=A0A1K1W151_9GAMM|nr:hypothetical protein [Marinospirillum alkaliphilum]SFX31126.1 hypothetical protein SAMN02745752_01215 [Marinospirillum alkaliphilum DSM 21637]
MEKKPNYGLARERKNSESDKVKLEYANLKIEQERVKLQQMKADLHFKWIRNISLLASLITAILSVAFNYVNPKKQIFLAFAFRDKTWRMDICT